MQLSLFAFISESCSTFRLYPLLQPVFGFPPGNQEVGKKSALGLCELQRSGI